MIWSTMCIQVSHTYQTGHKQFYRPVITSVAQLYCIRRYIADLAVSDIDTVWSCVLHSCQLPLSAEGVSALKAAADTCDAAIAFAKNDVANAITEWWTQPAVNAVPWLKCRFRLFFLLHSS